jgi:hypothetical protein
MIRTPAIRKIAKGAGTIVLGLVALDLFATAITLALGWSVIKR